MRDELDLDPGAWPHQSRSAGEAQSGGVQRTPRPDRRTPFKIVFDVLREPMIALLIAGGAVDLALGDWHEALILLLFATLSIVITVVQETRTERVLEALRDLTRPQGCSTQSAESDLQHVLTN